MASDSLVEAWFMICWGHLGRLMGATPVGAQGLGGAPGQVNKDHLNGIIFTKIDV